MNHRPHRYYSAMQYPRFVAAVTGFCTILAFTPGVISTKAQNTARRRAAVPAATEFVVSPATITLTVGDKASVSVSPTSIPLDEVNWFTSSDSFSLERELSNTSERKLIITALKPGLAYFTATYRGVVQRVDVQIQQPAVTRVESNLKADEPTMLALGDKLIVRLKPKDKKGDDIPAANLTLTSDDESAVTVQGRTLAGMNLGKAAVQVKQDERTVETFEVEVYEPQIVFDNEYPIVRAGRATKIGATVLDHNGDRLRNARVEWSVTDPAQGSAVRMVSTGNTATIYREREDTSGQAKDDALCEVTARYKGTEKRVFARLREAYQPLKVAIDVVDERTAKDLFGGLATREFYVARVTFTNKSADEQITGAPLIAFTETMRVGVGLEKRVKNKKGNNAWVPYTKEDHGQTHKVDEAKCRHFLTVRPYGYDELFYSAENRIRRSRKERSLRFIDVFKTSASAVTGVVVPGAGNALIPALEKLSNGVLPGYERFLSGTRGEVLSDAILQQIMKPMEEVAPHRKVARYLFLPKKAIQGLLQDHDIRISEICTEELSTGAVEYMLLTQDLPARETPSVER